MLLVYSVACHSFYLTKHHLYEENNIIYLKITEKSAQANKSHAPQLLDNAIHIELHVIH